MISKAEAKYLRMSARKTRLVVELIKGKSLDKANFILENTNKGACLPIKKVLKSAFANANNEKQEKFLEKDLRISAIRVDGGPMLKRYRAATMGRATSIKHRTLHLYIELDKSITKKDRSKTETKTKKTASKVVGKKKRVKKSVKKTKAK
ncbi:MAG: 50S ribosomal protein L22 [Candidatus Aadella gelida]|nr:50S ribosomal protein L22 [Candidatus Aadella gelida]